MFTWCSRGEWTGGENGGPGVGRSTRVPGAAGTQHRTTRHLRATASPFLPHLEPKSKLSSRPCPPPPLQPARALDRQTSPVYPAPMLSSQSPKATQPTRLGPIRPGGCTRGQARPGARMFAGTGPFPACHRGDGRAGRCNWCWLTGYIFDTFNEFIQTFHKEGLARVTAAVL